MRTPNLRSALDARMAFCFHFESHWPGASESDRSAKGMKSLSIVLLAVLLGGCAANRDANAPPPRASVATAQGSRSVDSFRFIGPHTTMQELTSKLGKPDRDIGSGLYVYAYRLHDGSDVLIGSGDGSEILYVRHGAEVLFQKK